MTQGNRGLLVALSLVLAAIAAFAWTLQGRNGGPASGEGAPAHAELSASRPASLGVQDGSEQGKANAAPLRTEVEAKPQVGAAGDPAGMLKLRGRLVDAAGAPLAGIQVHATPIDFDADFARRVATSLASGKPTFPKSDADGRFELSIAKAKKHSLTVASPKYLFSRQAGEITASGTSMILQPAETDLDLGNLELLVAATVSGSVRDAAGKPIEGARVRALAEDADLLSFVFAGTDSGETTDANGAFTLGPVAAGKVRLQASSRSHLPQRLEVEVRAGEQKTGIEFSLADGFAVSGRVVDDTGRPIAGARVSAQKRSLEGGLAVETSRGEATTKADAGGNFTLSGLEDASVTLLASAKGHQRQKTEDVPIGSGDVTLLLKRLGAIEGNLVDAAGQPIAGSEIVAEQSNERDPFTPGSKNAKTAADGSWRIEGLAPGVVNLHAQGDGHLRTQPSPIALATGETVKGVRLVARVGACVVATVTDAAGKPVAGAKVDVRKPNTQVAEPANGDRVVRRVVRRASRGGFVVGGDEEALGTATTDKDGRATIRGLEAGPVVVLAEHKGFASTQPTPLVLPEAGTVEASLALRKGGQVALTVVDADNAPLANTDISLEGPRGVPELTKTHSLETDGKGLASAKGLAPGTYVAQIVVSSEPMNFGGAMVVMGEPEAIEESKIEITVREDETSEARLVRPLMSTLTGVVRDAKGPVKGVDVEVTKELPEGSAPGFGRQKRGKTDAEGRYKIGELLPGKYGVSFGPKSAITKHEDDVVIQIGQREVEKNLLLQGSTVTLTALSALDGKPIKKAKASIRRVEQAQPGQPRRMRQAKFSIAMNSGGNNEDEVSTSMFSNEAAVQTDDEGKAKLENVPPGRWEIEIEHPKHAPVKVPAFDLGPSTSLDVGTHKLSAGGTIAGEITRTGGESLFMGMVHVLREGEREETADRVHAMQGSFKKSGLAPGRYRVRGGEPTEAGERLGEWQTVDVKPGETTRIKLETPK